MTILELLVAILAAHALVIVGTRWGLLARLHSAVNELAGIVQSFRTGRDDIQHDLAEHRRILSGDLMALETGLGSVQQRVEDQGVRIGLAGDRIVGDMREALSTGLTDVLDRLPTAAERQADFERWAATVILRARKAATPQIQVTAPDTSPPKVATRLRAEIGALADQLRRTGATRVGGKKARWTKAEKKAAKANRRAKR